jgi:hypothetical protein
MAATFILRPLLPAGGKTAAVVIEIEIAARTLLARGLGRTAVIGGAGAGAGGVGSGSSSSLAAKGAWPPKAVAPMPRPRPRPDVSAVLPNISRVKGSLLIEISL